ncbi:MAG: hypothetical protein H6811_09220 [Phycisphaeraceae bacterium]|nr:hypothetical protein [Phycisphaeraceae bacterium]
MAGRGDMMDELEAIDPEGPSAEDLERFGDEFRTCPECGSLVYDQSEICQACGHAFEEKDAPVSRWWIAAVVVVLLAFVLVFVL